MHIVVLICTILVIAEFLMAPVNLWTGRTLPTFRQFTGLSDRVAKAVFAPVKLVGALLIAAGLLAPVLTYAGCAVVGLICVAYFICLSRPSGRDRQGYLAFGLFFALTVVVFPGRVLG